MLCTRCEIEDWPIDDRYQDPLWSTYSAWQAEITIITSINQGKCIHSLDERFVRAEIKKIMMLTVASADIVSVK